MQGHGTGVNLGVVQDVVQDAQEEGGRLPGLFDEVSLLRVQICAFEQGLQSHHRGERGADLVAHVGKKRGLRPRQPLGMLAGVDELLFGLHLRVGHSCGYHDGVQVSVLVENRPGRDRSVAGPGSVGQGPIGHSVDGEGDLLSAVPVLVFTVAARVTSPRASAEQWSWRR